MDTGTGKVQRFETVADFVWYWRSRLPERKGQRCRVLARGRMNTIAVQFEDGYAVTTSRFAVRRG